MATRYQHHRTATASKVPATTDFVGLGEVLLNTYDGKIFLLKSVSGVQSVVDVIAVAGALGASTAPVQSVNGGTGAVSISLAGLSGSQSAHTVYAGPTSGGAVTPTWRQLAVADITGAAPTASPTFTGGITTDTLSVTSTSTHTGLTTLTGGASFGSAATFGSVVGSSVTDLSKHIALYGSSYGLSITGSRLNIVTASGASIVSVINGVDVLSVSGGTVYASGIFGTSGAITAGNHFQAQSSQACLSQGAYFQWNYGGDGATWIANQRGGGGGGIYFGEKVASVAWATATAYTIGTIVSSNGNLYYCDTAHTSSGTGVTGGSSTANSCSDGTHSAWHYVNLNAAFTTNMHLDYSGNLTTTGSVTTGNTLSAISGTSVANTIYFSGNANGTYPTSNFGGSIGFNYSSGSCEVDFWNVYTSAASSFAWYQLTGTGTKTTLATLSTAGALTLTAGITATGLSVLSTSTSGIPTATISATSDTNGVNLLLAGNGSTTPNKTLRVLGGLFQLINSAYSAVIFQIDDVGNTTVYGNLLSDTLTTTAAITTTGSSSGFYSNDRSTSGQGCLYRMGGINRLWDSPAGDVITYGVFSGAARVGILTPTPGYTLDITGTLNVSGAATFGGSATFSSGLNSTPIGSTTPSTGSFTSLVVNNGSVYGQIRGSDEYHQMVIRADVTGVAAPLTYTAGNSMCFVEYGGVWNFRQITGTANTLLFQISGGNATLPYNLTAGSVYAGYVRVAGSGANLGGASGSTIATNYSMDNSGYSLFGWNLTGGGGETDLIINRNGGSTGGLLIYDLANTTHALTQIFNLSGAGNLSVPGTITASNSLGSQVFNVQSYYVSGDTDDTMSIQRAYAALHAAGRGILYFPPKNYLVHAYSSTSAWGPSSTSMSLSCTYTNGSYIMSTSSTSSITKGMVVTGGSTHPSAVVTQIISGTQFAVSHPCYGSGTTSLNFYIKNVLNLDPTIPCAVVGAGRTTTNFNINDTQTVLFACWNITGSADTNSSWNISFNSFSVNNYPTSGSSPYPSSSYPNNTAIMMMGGGWSFQGGSLAQPGSNFLGTRVWDIDIYNLTTGCIFFCCQAASIEGLNIYGSAGCGLYLGQIPAGFVKDIWCNMPSNTGTYYTYGVLMDGFTNYTSSSLDWTGYSAAAEGEGPNFINIQPQGGDYGMYIRHTGFPNLHMIGSTSCYHTGLYIDHCAGLTLTNSQMGSFNNPTVVVANSTTFAISNSVFQGNVGFGIQVFNSTKGVINGCYLDTNNTGNSSTGADIYVDTSQNIAVSDCQFLSNPSSQTASIIETSGTGSGLGSTGNADNTFTGCTGYFAPSCNGSRYIASDFKIVGSGGYGNCDNYISSTGNYRFFVGGTNQFSIASGVIAYSAPGFFLAGLDSENSSATAVTVNMTSGGNQDPDSGVTRDAKFCWKGIAVIGGTKTDTLVVKTASSSANALAITLTAGGSAGNAAITVTTAVSTQWLAIFAAAGYGFSGSITASGSGIAFNTSSDYRLKTVFGPASSEAFFANAQVHDAAYTDHINVRRPMFLAHELQALAPFAVLGTKDAVDADGKIIAQQVDHMSLIPLMVAEIQSLRARVKTLEGSCH